jgi:hypothetical protein
MAAKDKLIFGGPLNQEVQNQIQLRQNVAKNENKTVEEISLMNNRGGWVKLTSGVNEITEELGENYNQLRRDLYSEDLAISAAAQKALKQGGNHGAKNFILTGGTLRQYETKSGKTRTAMKSGLNLSSTEHHSSYSNTSAGGIRPMPGITDLKVKSKSTYGALKEIELSIKVFTLEDLNKVDKLYFRPGYGMLVEYGANTYIDKEGEILSQTQSVFKSFLNGSDLDKVSERAKLWKEESGFNYEALFAKVTNFSWDYNQDGTYDCTVKLISKGELMESLSTTIYNSKKSVLSKTAELNTRAGTSTKGGLDKSDALSALFASCMWSTQANRDAFLANLPKDNRVTILRSQELGIDQNVDQNNQEDSEKSKNYHWFMPIRDLLYLINHLIIPHGSDFNSKPFKLSTDFGVKNYTTFNEHMSIDPGICIVPYPGSGKRFQLNSAETYDRRSFFGNQTRGGATPARIFTDCYKQIKKKHPEKIEGTETLRYGIKKPLSICVNINHLAEIQNSFLEEKKADLKSNTAIYTFLRKVLKDCETAMGGINNFDLIYDEGDNEWSVVDRATPLELTKKTAPKLNLVGKGSTINSINISSKISSKIASVLSISASGASNGRRDQGNLLHFNKNLFDRYAYANPKELGIDLVNERLEMERIISDIGGAMITYGYGTYDEGKFRDNTIKYREYSNIRLAQSDEQKRVKKQDTGFAGLLPIELSLTMQGITGFRVGESFQVSKGVLPERYDGRVAFIVTQIEQSISPESRWETNLSTRMLMLATPENLQSGIVEIKEPKENRKEAATSYKPKYKKSNATTPTNQPWSAAFVSYCALKGDSSFPKSASHTKYAQRCRSSANWDTIDPSKTTPKVGDIVIEPRAGNDLRFTQSKWSGFSHGDIVVYVKGRVYHTIGGNVSQTCKKKYKTAPTSGKYNSNWAICLRPTSAVNITAITSEAEREWRVWHEDTANQRVDQETTANKELPRSPLIFERLRTYWASVNWNNFEKDTV